MITVAAAYRGASAVALRRAALYALRLAMEAYLPLDSRANSSSNIDRQRRIAAEQSHNPLGALMNISNLSMGDGCDNIGDDAEGDGGASPGAAALSIMSQPVLVECVDWAASSWRDDADEVGRALKQEIVSMAVKGLSS